MLSELWRPLLVAFTVIVAVVVILIIVFSGGGDEPYVTGPVEIPKPKVSPGELDVAPKKKNPESDPVAGTDLKVGDCLANAIATTAQVTTFDGIDCDKAHDGEVFTIIKLKDTEKYPGTRFVSGKGLRGCRARLRRQATRKAYRDRQLNYKFVYPTAQSWAEGDREVTCVATWKKPRKTKLARRENAKS